MAKDRPLYRIFISSPRDCETERETAIEVIRKLDNDSSFSSRMELQPRTYERNVAPSAEPAQPTIDSEIGPYEIYVGILANRFGTPTGRWSSGTEHEYHRALKAYKAGKCKRIMFYFSKSPTPCSTLEDCKQRRKVLKFKAKLEGTLYREYERATFGQNFE